MHWFMLLLLATLIAGGYYVYQRLLKIEREIRAEQHLATEPKEEVASVELPGVDALSGAETPAEPAAESDLSAEMLAFVALKPGSSQAELYAGFPDIDRRELQKRLRDLAQTGNLRREKEGSSYRLYPA